MKNTNERFAICKSAKVLALTTIIAVSGCLQAPPPLGTAEQADAARVQFNEGLANIDTLSKEFSDVINRYTQVPVVNKIISEPPKQITLDIPKADIQDFFGVYQETSPGQFSLTPGGHSIAVQYINGVDLILDRITYYIDTRLKSYILTVTSDNRGIDTPTAEEINIDIKEFRPDFSKFVPTLLNTGTSTIGNYSFSRDGVNATQMRITRNQGTLEAVGVTMSAVKQLRFDDNTTAENVFHESLETIVYLKSDLPGVWWGFSATQSYSDPLMSLNIVMRADKQSLSVDGLASFVAEPSLSRIVYEGKRVATLSGGPYTCDMQIAFDVGTGTSIDLNWIDTNSTVDTIFPSLKFPCNRTVLSLPPLL